MEKNRCKLALEYIRDVFNHEADCSTEKKLEIIKIITEDGLKEPEKYKNPKQPELEF